MSVKLPPHPMQPLVVVDDRVRFKANKIVRYLLDRGSINLNKIAAEDFQQEDLDQFYQLIGTSVGGYDELCGGGIISESAANAAAHAMCQQFGTTYGRCLDEGGCPIHKDPKKQ